MRLYLRSPSTSLRSVQSRYWVSDDCSAHLELGPEHLNGRLPLGLTPTDRWGPQCSESHMSDRGIRIRPARPDPDEGRLFARFVEEITEGGFRIMLGPRVVDVLAHAFVQPGHTMSYQTTSFAERDGQIVGMVCGHLALALRECDEALMTAPGNRFRRRLGVAFVSLRRRMIGHPYRGEFYVEFLIVGSAVRGTGIGGVLMDAAESAAREAGAGRLTLDVVVRNIRAQRFYERRGMVRVQDPSKSRLGRRVVVRMAKTLA